MDQISKNNRAAKEFAVLDQIFPWGQAKKTMNLFGHLNIYSDVFPYIETQVFIRNGKTRQEVLKEVKEDNYINASYIKSAYREHKESEDPFGYIIATQGPQDYSRQTFW